MALVSFAEMQDVIASAFINAGMIEQEARQCARIHTESTLDGVNSHGLNRVARFVWAFIGTAAMQKGPLWWAGHHVNHHKYADRDGDPHSPMVSGFYYAHIGWFLNDTRHDTLEASNPVIRDRVAKRAYEKWTKGGCQNGCEQRNWLEAEAEILAEQNRTGNTGSNYR